MMHSKRKNLKAVSIRRFQELSYESVVLVPGGRLFQSTDVGTKEEFRSVTKLSWPQEKTLLRNSELS